MTATKRDRRLFELVTGCRLICRPWWGMSRSFEDDKLTETARQLGAGEDMISAKHKLVNTAHPRVKGINSIKAQAVKLYHLRTLEYTEAGIRLIPKDRVEYVAEEMNQIFMDLPDAVNALDQAREEILAEARQRLGKLFKESDYPLSWQGKFAMEFRLASVEPPNYLQQVNPKAYQEEIDRVVSDVRRAAEQFTQECYAELGNLTTALLESLTPTPDGTKKRFHASKLTNLTDFFERMKSMNLTNDKELENLLGQAHDIVAGLDPTDLRNGSKVKEAVRADLEVFRAQLPSLTENMPRRKITPRVQPNQPQPEPQLQEALS